MSFSHCASVTACHPQTLVNKHIRIVYIRICSIHIYIYIIRIRILYVTNSHIYLNRQTDVCVCWHVC
jgi:hypothetical protein